MIRRALTFDVPPRVLVAALVLTGGLLVSVVAGGAREARALDTATTGLRSAVVEAAAIVSCFEGVQDDLYAPGGGRSATSAAQARTRLATCDVGALEGEVESLRLPPPSPVAVGVDPRLRSVIEEARAALRRVVLDVRGTKLAMARELKEARKVTAVLLGYQSTSAGYLRAVELLAEAEALLRDS